MSEIYEEPKPAGMSSGVKVAIGCGISALLVTVLSCAGLIFAAKFGFDALMEEVNKVAKTFEDQGYKRITKQVHQTNSAVPVKTVFVAQVIKLNGGSKDSLAICAQTVELDGTFKGDIDFFGQILVIKRGAVVEGDVRIKSGQVITILGTVNGKVTGTYQTLNYPNAPIPSEEPVDEATEAKGTSNETANGTASGTASGTTTSDESAKDSSKNGDESKEQTPGKSEEKSSASSKSDPGQ